MCFFFLFFFILIIVPFPLQYQFYIVFINTCVSIYFVRIGQCFFPEWMGWCTLIYLVSMIGLFSAFYIHAYTQGKRAPPPKPTKTD